MKRPLMLLFSVAVGIVLFSSPVPDGLSTEAWQLFAIFGATILCVLTGGTTLFLAAILALVAAVLTGTLDPDAAYAGFSKGFILLIVVAFLVGKGVVNSGLGARIGYLLVSRFGRSPLGLAYSIMATDAVIAPAFPSNTARSGVLFPIVYSLAENNGSHPGDESRHRIGAYLMLCAMVSLALSSGLWLTAMAANPAGVAIAAEQGVSINFASWFIAASVPTFCAIVVLPWLLYKVFPPTIGATPEAPGLAQAALKEMGPFSRKEWITLSTFVTLVGGWALAGIIGFDATAIAFLGLALLIMGGVFSVKDLRESGAALETLIWFAILYTLSTELNRLGFMSWAGNLMGGAVTDFAWPITYVLLLCLYVIVHYLFVSQTAHLLALFGVFLALSQPNVPLPLMAMMLLLATNFFSVLTPQASSCNVIFVGSGYITGGEVYKYGGLATAACLLIFLLVGTPWILWVL